MRIKKEETLGTAHTSTNNYAQLIDFRPVKPPKRARFREWLNRLGWGLYVATRDKYGDTQNTVTIEVKGQAELDALNESLKALSENSGKSSIREMAQARLMLAKAKQIEAQTRVIKKRRKP